MHTVRSLVEYLAITAVVATVVGLSSGGRRDLFIAESAATVGYVFRAGRVSRRPRLACAAIRIGEHVIACPRPMRHPDVFGEAWAALNGDDKVEEGFITTDGEYVDSVNAVAVVLASRQVLITNRPDRVTTGDLW